MRRICFIAVLVWLVAGFSAVTAEIYKYRDAQGVMRYTYDLAEVPEDQRPKVQTYEETPAAVGADPTSKKEEVSADTIDGDAKDGTPPVDEEKIKELNQKKKDLDAEFAGLMEEKYKLLKEKEKLAGSLAGRDKQAVAKYDDKVKKLNRKIEEYQKRRETFQKEAEEVQKALETPKD